MNQVVAVGRIVSIEPNRIIKIGVTRPFKDVSGDYEVDYVTCELKEKQIENVKEFLVVGDLIAVKGSLSCTDKQGIMVVTAEKLTFLSSKQS